MQLTDWSIQCQQIARNVSLRAHGDTTSCSTPQKNKHKVTFKIRTPVIQSTQFHGGPRLVSLSIHPWPSGCLFHIWRNSLKEFPRYWVHKNGTDERTAWKHNASGHRYHRGRGIKTFIKLGEIGIHQEFGFGFFLIAYNVVWERK